MDSDPVRRPGPERGSAEGEVVLGAPPPARPSQGRRCLPAGGAGLRHRLAPEPKGYGRFDEHGRTVAGDASGEWLLDENGDVIDVVFFISPGFLHAGR